MSENFGTYTRIVGVTQKNEDGTDRQELIAALTPGDSVEFERDYDNEHDENAIAVLNTNGERLGFIRASLAETLAPIMDNGGRVVGMVADVTGGGISEDYGCNLRIEVFSSNSSQSISTSPSQNAVPSDMKPRPFFSSLGNGLLLVLGVIAAIAIILIVMDVAIKYFVTSSDSTSNSARTTQKTTSTTTTINSSEIKQSLQIKSCTTSEPNSAGGVDLEINFANTSDKTIKYITFTVEPYNAVGDIVECDIRDRSRFRGKITGPIDSGNSQGNDYYWECAWYNNTIVRAEILSVEIEYTDGSTLEIPEEYIRLIQP